MGDNFLAFKATVVKSGGPYHPSMTGGRHRGASSPVSGLDRPASSSVAPEDRLTVSDLAMVLGGLALIAVFIYGFVSGQYVLIYGGLAVASVAAFVRLLRNKGREGRHDYWSAVAAALVWPAQFVSAFALERRWPAGQLHSVHQVTFVVSMVGLALLIVGWARSGAPAWLRAKLTWLRERRAGRRSKPA